MSAERVVHSSRGRPPVQVLVTTIEGETWCPGYCRMSTRHSTGVWVHNVEWWPPGEYLPRIDNFPAERVRSDDEDHASDR